MPMKIKCPNPECRKTLNVEDQFVGKKVKCPACKKVLSIPVPPPVSTPAPPASSHDAELLAARLLADEPKSAPVEEPRTVDFNCPYCDEELHLDAGLAGKQSPCPECKRIIKVPHLKAQQKADWRGGAVGIPSGARRDSEPAPEGAWGSTAKTLVSGEALAEAGALPSQRREPLTLKQWILRGVIAASSVGVLVIGVLLLVSWLGGKRQEKMLARATANLSKMPNGEAAVLNLAAGRFHLGRNDKDSIKPEKGDRGAWNQFGAARNRLAAANTPEADSLLIELALAQLDMAGSQAEVSEGKRWSWSDTLKEVGQTLARIHQPEQRVEGLRRVTRALIAREQAGLARDLARQLGGAEVLAVVALEYLRADQKDEAGKLFEQVKDALQPRKGPDGKPLKGPDGKPVPVPLSVDAITLLVAMRADKAVPDTKDDKLKDVIAVGKAAGFAWRGQPADLAQAAAKASSPLVRLEALVAAADAKESESLLKKLADDAVTFAETKFVGTPLPGWLVVRLVREALQAGISEERILGLAQRLAPKDPMRGWVEMPVFRARLAQAEGKADEALLEIVDKGTLANAQARVELARHNTLKDPATEKAVDSWDEAVRPFGYIGVALGLQARN